MEARWRRQGPAPCKQGRDEFYAASLYAFSFRCLVEEWQDREELEAETESKSAFSWVKSWKPSNIAGSGVRTTSRNRDAAGAERSQGM